MGGGAAGDLCGVIDGPGFDATEPQQKKQESWGMVWIHGMMVILPVALIHHFSDPLIF